MSLPPLATPDDLRDYLPGVTIPTASALLALRIASRRIRKHTRQTLTFIEAETVILTGGERVLRLPQRPLLVDADHPLTVLEIPDGTGIEVPAVEGRDFTVQGNELTRGSPLYAPTRTMGWPYSRPLGVWADRVKVTYSHGYQEVPEDLLGVCLDLAAATVTNPRRLRSSSAGATSETYTVETFGTGSLTSDHRATLREYMQSGHSVRQS
ncbi:hypothetical protein AB0F46_21530 [Streptomyces sp. NPDC026665]|uniref:hypothetical protein n=1 Tax=Streptomyces sp. NPDC026665 TaxID=3154798 RepID=UPI0033D7E46E